MNALFARYDTFLGAIRIVAENGRVTDISFEGQIHRSSVDPGWMNAPDDPLLSKAKRQIEEYLAGKRRTFTFPAKSEGTPFQKKVWEGLTGIPYGKTVSYRDLTLALGKTEKHTRAVAAAIARNPLTLYIPCHRVIGSDGSLTGYAGGLDRKKVLLSIENPDRKVKRRS